jgi:predicted dehydrogenase
MQNDKVRVAVIGVGSLGQWHARIYSEMENTELVGVYDADPKRAAEIAERYNTTPFESMEDLADKVDAASIVVPTHLHFEVVKRIMPHKIHLLVEKPIASSYEQALQMVNMAEEQNVILQIGHVERFNPVMKFLADNLTGVRFIEASRLAAYPPPATGPLPAAPKSA